MASPVQVRTNCAYFSWGSSVSGRGTNFGESHIERRSRIFGFCSVRHLREEAFDFFIGQIAKQIQDEVAEANKSTNR